MLPTPLHRFVVLTAIFTLILCAVVIAPCADGQEGPPFEEEQDPAPPPAGCLGPNDPFCDSGGGSDPPDPRCHVCTWIPEGPNGESAYWTCAIDNSCCDPELSNCSDGWSFCDFDGYCVYT